MGTNVSIFLIFTVLLIIIIVYIGLKNFLNFVCYLFQVTFEVDIEVTSCPKDPNEWNQTFNIYPVGLNEAMTIHLEMICECDCEKPWNEVHSNN